MTIAKHLSSIDTLRHVVGEASRTTVLLSALGLAMRARVTGTPPVPEVANAIDRLLSQNGLAHAVATAAPQELASVLALIQAELLFGGHILGDGVGARGWQDRDPEVMQAFGRVSHGFWRGFEQLAATAAPELLQRLGQPGARFLDIGTGTAWLAIGMMQRWPSLTAVGIEPLLGALDIARRNLADAALDGRMELRHGYGERLDETAAYDLIFVPSAFIPAVALPELLLRCRAALRPNGKLLLAVLNPSDQSDASAFIEFRAAVWGGDVLGVRGGTELLRAAGFHRVRAMQQPGGIITFLLATPQRWDD